MSRVTLGLLTASIFGLAATSPALAGGCCGWGGGWNIGWGGWGGGCCSSGFVAVQPAPVFVQPAPVFVQPAPPIVVQAPPQQIIVQQARPQVFFQPAPTYTVNQGPYYAGPHAIGYAPPRYHFNDIAVRPYPFVHGYRPVYRDWRRHSWRPYRRSSVRVHWRRGDYRRGGSVRWDRRW